ncbi:MAG: ATP-dependent helicase [Clostridium perfringens]|nr:ATP-dependent helicase [Clostridium perfringens]
MNLDKFQSAAVKANGKSTLVVAPPGSGKTTVILGKVNYLIEKEGVSFKNILVITFTKAAAKNMEERYKKNYSSENIPFFGTFHGLFYRILIRAYKNISIINSNVAFFIIKKELENFSEDVNDNKIKEVLNMISLKKTGASLEFKNVSEDIFSRCFNIYEEFKRKNNLLDFNDLQKIAYDMLSKEKNILDYYKRQFKYILVDEFQDCDMTQINFLKLIDSNIFCVGDEDQCIYSFRGSSPIYMIRFNEEFKGGKKIYLKYNYRSAKSVVDLSRGVISKNKERNEKEVVNYKKHLGITKFYRVEDEKAQGKNIVNTIIKNKENNFYKDNAVLYRTNLESRSIIDSLIKSKIPFAMLDSEYNFYNHLVCKDLLSYLRLSINICDKESFSNIINKPFRYISKSNVQNVLNSRENRDVFDLLIEKSDIHPFQLKNIEKTKQMIKGLNKKSPEKAVITILNDLEYNEYIKAYCDRYKQDAEEVLNIINEFKEASLEFKTIIEFLNHVNEVEKTLKDTTNNKDCVKLSTIHGVKGMEFKNVFIINAVDEYMPHKSSNDLEEERRIFYVGITRAIDNLYIYSPKKINKSFMKITKFMDDLLILEEKGKENNIKNPFKKGQRVLSKAYGEGSVEDVTKDIVKVFFGDNTLRMFNIKVVVESNLLEVLE